MKAYDRDKFEKIDGEAAWDDYAAHIDNAKRAELSKNGYNDLHEKMPCPKCGKAMLRANQLKDEKQLENNPWFVHTNDKGKKEPVHANCCDGCDNCSK